MRSLSIVTELSRALSRSYGKGGRRVHSAKAAVLALIACAALLGGLVTADAADRPVMIVALGDSLTAGYGLSRQDAFPAQLEKALKAKGIAVEIENAGVSGDTASGGLSRVDWSVGDGIDAVIVELGGNDMLRGVDPKVTRDALSEIVRRLKARHIEVLLCGMLAAPNLGADYGRAFDAIYPELAAVNGLLLYPFFLDGVAADPKLHIGDGLHPTGEGVAKIVAGILPKAEALLARVRAKSGT